MVIQCPQCHAELPLKESSFAGGSEARVRCPQCAVSLSVRRGPKAGVTAQPMPEVTLVSEAGGVQLPVGKKVAVSVTEGPLKGKVFQIAKPRVVLGRKGTDIVLDDPEVSRTHCALEVHGATATLLDLGSRNGTFINNERIETAELEHMAEFRVGLNTLMFTVTSKT